MALIRSNTSAAEWSNYNLGDYEEQKQDFLKDIQKEAEDILKKANEKASHVLQDAYKKGREKLLSEIDELKKKSIDEGFKEGLEKGKAEGILAETERIKSDADPLVTVLKNAAISLETSAEQMLAEAEEKLVQTSMDLAKAVIDVEPKFNQDVLVSRLKKSMGYLKPELELIVKIHPTDVALAQKYVPKILDDLGVSPKVKWVEDEEVEASSVQVRSGESEVQFNQFLQWEKLLTLLKEKSKKS